MKTLAFDAARAAFMVLASLSTLATPGIVHGAPNTTNVVSVVGDDSIAAGGSVLAFGFAAPGGAAHRSVSGDGRFVVFVSNSGALGPLDNNGYADIYLRDRKLDFNHRITVGQGGRWVDAPSDRPTISFDGRYVAFESYASTLVAGDANGAWDVFVHDRNTGKIERVSVSSTGVAGDDESRSPSISNDGRYVAFYSRAGNLVAGTSPAEPQVYLRDRVAGTTTQVSVNSAGTKANGASLNPSISGDGRYVAFQSVATNLAPGGDANDERDIFVRDRVAGTTIRVSSTADGSAGNAASDDPAISLDGRYVAFVTSATDLAPGSNGQFDILLTDLQTKTTERISVAVDGGPADGGLAGSASISADGRFVAFYSGASNLVPNDTNGLTDVFVRDRSSRTTERVSVSSSGGQGTGPSGERVSISADGRLVAFNSWSPDIVANDFNGDGDVYARERADVTTSSSLAIWPKPMTFGNVTIGTSATQTFWLKNTGSAPLQFASISLQGPDRTMFKGTNLCSGRPLAGDATCKVRVTFVPTSIGFKEARLRVELANGTVRYREVSGTGVSP